MKRNILSRLAICTVLAAVITISPQFAQAKPPAQIPDCANTTLDQSIGKVCKSAYWTFYVESYTASATGGAVLVPASNVSITPTLYPSDHEFYGLTIAGIDSGWSVSDGQTQESEIVIWIGMAPGFNNSPAYFLNGMDSIKAQGGASITAQYSAYDGQNNPVPQGGALLYKNSSGAVYQQAYTQIFQPGMLLPLVMHLKISLSGNGGRAKAGTFFFALQSW